MSANRDLTHTVRSWLQEERYEDASRVLDLVLDQLDATHSAESAGSRGGST